MDLLRRAAMLTLCQQAVHGFYAALDDGRIDDLLATLAPDGVWHRQGLALQGHDAVRAALAQRPAHRVTAHLVQNLVVTLDRGDQATARYMALTYRHDGDAAGTAPIGLPLSITRYQDRLGLTGDIWLIREKRSSRVFG